MNIHSTAEKIAAYLVASPEFKEHGYTALSGVRVKDIFLNGKPLEGSKTVDLLVCDGSRVLSGVACSLDEAKLFNLDMRGLPYVRLPDTDGALPLSPEDDGWLDYPSEACLESLLKSVMLSLHRVRCRQEKRSLASYRKQSACPWTEGEAKQAGKVYTLSMVPPERIVDKRYRNVRNLYNKMAAKQLLRSDFTPTPYGNAHGLFLRYHADPFGGVSPELLTVPGAAEDIRSALFRHPGQMKKAKRLSLAERTRNIQNRPAAGEYDMVSAVEDLLNTPADSLLRSRPGELQQLLNAMKSSRSLLKGTAEPAEAMPLYRDVLKMIRDLRREFGNEPMLDDERSRKMRRHCEELLLLLSEIFLSPRSLDAEIPQGKPFVKNQSLQERLACVGGHSLFELFGMTLVDYYRAVSHLAECEYPNWVYRSRILPILNDSGKPETDFSLRFLAAYCKICREDNGDHDWDEAFPLLYDLIVIPICNKNF